MIQIDSEFLTGAIQFIDSFKNEARIVLPLNVDGVFIEAIVDTGAPFSILTPDIASELDIDISSGLKTPPLSTKFGEIDGFLHTLAVRIDNQVEGGYGIDLEVSFLVPLPEQGWPSDYNFVGLNSFLLAIRFAIDPVENLFYFGQSAYI